MQIEGSTILVTGANRGIGRALVDAALSKGAARVEQLDILINNAGVVHYDDLSDGAALEAQLAVNLFGTYGVTQAFLPALERAGGALVNNVSMMALAPFPVTPAYAVSKAAAFNLTQSLRGLLAPRAQAILAGLEAGEEEIFPDPLSAQLADSWRNGVGKAFEHQFALAIAA
jgi:NAD(P)-dependent dehydrogenase (short-subunit alcohol dehydrogenase family)